MPSCSIQGGCQNPNIESCHHCKVCGDPIHNLCLQSLTGVQDSPAGGWVCGAGDRCRKEAAPPAPSHQGPSNVTANVVHCAAGSRCDRKATERLTVRRDCCGRYSHLFCVARPCEACESMQDEEEEDIETGCARGEAIDVDAQNSGVGVDGGGSSGLNAQGSRGAAGGVVPKDSPAPSTSKKIGNSNKGAVVTPTRESEMIRNAQAQAEVDASAKAVVIDSESAGTVLCAAVSDGFVGAVKSPQLVKAFSAVVKDKLFENAVIDATKKLPVTKAQMRKTNQENSATVHGILTDVLQPQLQEATKGVLTAASAAEALMKTAGVAMNRATAELKAATGAEMRTCKPAETKKGGRKAKAKKDEGTSSGTGQDEVAGDLMESLPAALSAEVKPSFHKLTECFHSSQLSTVSVVRDGASREHAVMMEGLLDLKVSTLQVLTSLQESVAEVLETSNRNMKEMRRLLNTTGGTTSSTTSHKQQRKKAPQHPPSPATSSGYESADAPEEPPRPPVGS